MLRFADDLRVYLYREPIDFRCGINTLAALVEDSMQMDPLARAVYAFHNRKWNQTTFSIPIEARHNGVSMASIARPATSSGSP
jgi:transposase